jgi:hypothetical protein
MLFFEKFARNFSVFNSFIFIKEPFNYHYAGAIFTSVIAILTVSGWSRLACRQIHFHHALWGARRRRHQHDFTVTYIPQEKKKTGFMATPRYDRKVVISKKLLRVSDWKFIK